MEAMRRPKPYTWSVSSLTHQGETDSGDKCVVKEFDGGALVAVIDALGHGRHAAHAADVAVRTLQCYAHEPPAALVERCHAAMRGTRGAAISIASFDWLQRAMTWLGVGNVAGVIVLAEAGGDPQLTSLLVRGGVVGDRLPELQPSVVPFAAGTTLIVATDGVRRDFTETLPAMLEPQRLAKHILDGYATHDDDAAVLVFRYGDP
jgi:phosphoserine phosphatase RsbX